MWLASHSGQESEIMAMMDSGLPELSVLHTPAGAGQGRQGSRQVGAGEYQGGNAGSTPRAQSVGGGQLR